MLYSVVLGDVTSSINNNWVITNDTYGNAFIANESIHQKIRIGKNVKKHCEQVAHDNDYAVYEISSSTFLSNNNKNMNLSLMNFWPKDAEEKEKHVDDNIVYITFLNKDYKMLRYSTNTEVLQTYRQRGIYQGLAVVFSNLEEISDRVIFAMDAYDCNKNGFINIVVMINTDGNPVVTYNTITDKSTISLLNGKMKKLGNKVNHFVMDVDDFPTNTFIIDSKYDEQIKKILGDTIPNAKIISLVGGSEAFSENRTQEEKDIVDSLFKQCIVNERVRAVTTVGVRLPKSFFKTYNILYLFDYNVEKNTIRCVRSN